MGLELGKVQASSLISLSPIPFIQTLSGILLLHSIWHVITHHLASGEEQPHVQGAAVAWAQEGQEELLHVQGQEG